MLNILTDEVDACDITYQICDALAVGTVFILEISC
jgi:hypothetical protein